MVWRLSGVVPDGRRFAVDQLPVAVLLLENRISATPRSSMNASAYGYPAHSRSAAAGYAAVYAQREQLKSAQAEQRDAIGRHVAICSVRRHVPKHEDAAANRGAAADDMYEMKDYGPAVDSARRVIDTYPNADAAIRRSVTVGVAHGSFELDEYPQAEQPYSQVLAAAAEATRRGPAL